MRIVSLLLKRSRCGLASQYVPVHLAGQPASEFELPTPCRVDKVDISENKEFPLTEADASNSFGISEIILFEGLTFRSISGTPK
jgi:hypothetical protein